MKQRGHVQATFIQLGGKLKTVGDLAFSVVATKLWNAVPSDRKGENAFNVFKQRLKIHPFPR